MPIYGDIVVYESEYGPLEAVLGNDAGSCPLHGPLKQVSWRHPEGIKFDDGSIRVVTNAVSYDKNGRSGTWHTKADMPGQQAIPLGVSAASVLQVRHVHMPPEPKEETAIIAEPPAELPASEPEPALAPVQPKRKDMVKVMREDKHGIVKGRWMARNSVRKGEEIIETR